MAKPQSLQTDGSRDGRVYAWSDPGPAQVVHLTAEREVVLPAMTLCGWHAGPLWRMSIHRPVGTVLCIACRRRAKEPGMPNDSPIQTKPLRRWNDHHGPNDWCEECKRPAYGGCRDCGRHHHTGGDAMLCDNARLVASVKRA